MVFSSRAGAAEYQGDFLGEFLERGDYNGRMSYIQRDNVGQKDIFLYYHKQGVWLVGPVLGGTRNHLQNPRDSLTPPKKGWGFWGRKRFSLEFDLTLSLEYGSIVPCQEVIINGEGEVRHIQEGSLGTYKHLGKWSEGRPVYEREGKPNYFLFIREGLAGWMVKDSLNATVSKITSGRETNFPGPESGVSFRYGHRDWKWYNALLQDWIEGGIDVTCVMR